MKSINVMALVTAFFFILISLVNGQVKEVILSSGSTLILEPTAETEFVTIVALMDKTKLNADPASHLNAELFLADISNRLDAIASSSYKSPQRLIPENGYNWTEHQYSRINLTKEQFTRNMDRLIAVFLLQPDFRKPKVQRLLIDYSDVYADSSLYAPDKWQEINNNIGRLLNLQNANAKIFADPELLVKALNIYVYGNFDALEVLKWFDNHSPEQQKTIVSGADDGNVQGGYSSLKQTMDYSILRLRFEHNAPELYVFNLFISDLIKMHLPELPEVNEIRFYFPFSRFHPYLLVHLKHEGKAPDLKSIKKLFGRLSEVTADDFSEWYYSEYVNHAAQLKDNTANYLVMRLLSKLYFNQYDRFERIKLSSSELYKAFQALISGIDIEQIN